MAFHRGPRVVTDGLVLYLDVANPKSVDIINILEKTEKFNSSPWIRLGAPNVSIIENNYLSPIDTLTASKMTSNSISQNGIRQTIGKKILKTKTYTFSVWIRSDENTEVKLDISDMITPTFVSTTEWVRISTTSTGNINYVDGLQFVDIVFNSNQLGKSVYLWGAQMVEGTEPGEYISVDNEMIYSLVNGVESTLTNGLLVSDNKSLFFDGIDDRIRLDNQIELNQWSISYWSKMELTNNRLFGQTFVQFSPLLGTNTEGTIQIGDDLFYNVETMTPLLDGSIMVGGQFGGYDSQVRDTMVKIKSNGEIDNSYTRAIFASGVLAVTKIKQIGNGDIYYASTNYGVGGLGVINQYGSYTGTQLFGISSGTGGGGASICSGFIIDEPNNVLYVLGNWWNLCQGVNVSGKIVKMSLDTKVIIPGFDSSTGFRSTVGSTSISSDNGLRDGIITSDGNILFCGTFQEYKFVPTNRIVKVNSLDGSIDTSFNFGTGFNSATYIIVEQSDGKILVGGAFTSYNGTVRNRLIRLNSDGTIDNTFNIGSGFNNSVITIRIDTNNKIIVGGSFTSYNGVTQNRITRLNQDGSIDSSFENTTGFNTGSVRNIDFDYLGRMIVSGEYFNTFNGKPIPIGICRFSVDPINNVYGGQTVSPNRMVQMTTINSTFYPANDGIYVSSGTFRNITVTPGNLSPFNTRCSNIKNTSTLNGGLYLQHNIIATQSQNSKFIHCAVVKPITDCTIIIARASGLQPSVRFNFNTESLTFLVPNTSTSTTIQSECFMEPISDGFYYLQFTYQNSSTSTFDELTLVIEPNVTQDSEIELAYVGAFKDTTITSYVDAIVYGYIDETFYSKGINLPRYRGYFSVRLSGNVSQIVFNGRFGISGDGSRAIFDYIQPNGIDGGSVLYNNYNNFVITFGTDNTFRFYRNGIQYNSLPSTSGLPMTLKLYNMFFKDDLYCLSVYNRAISTDEVIQNYNSLSPRFNI